MFSRIINSFTSNTDTPTDFLAAVKANNISLVKAYIQRNPSLIHATDPKGGTGLFTASSYGCLQIADFLLANGARVNQATTDNGTTPLLKAAHNGHKDIVELLLNRGANANQATTKIGATPLMIAARYGYKDIVELLLSHDANANQATTDNGTTPLFVAAQHGHKDIVELLLNRGVNINQTTNDGTTPLFMAALNSHKDVVELLLDHDADIHLAWMTDDGRKITAYEQAINHGHVEIASMIRKKMAPSFSDRLEAIEYDESIPDKYLDTISSEIMNDPITVSSGITYDRNSLAGWFKQNNNPETLPCPTTKFIIHRRELENRANVIIKNDIEAFVTEKEKESKAEKVIPSMRALSASGMMQFSSSSSVPAADGVVGRVQLKS